MKLDETFTDKQHESTSESDMSKYRIEIAPDTFIVEINKSSQTKEAMKKVAADLAKKAKETNESRQKN